MAKASQKKKLLMPEEKLDEVLIPNTEEPYSVPSNWCWTKMGVVAKWGSGGTPSRKNAEYYNGTIPWVKTGELNDDYIWETEEHISEQAIADSSAKVFPINTIIIAMYGATIGKVGILGLEATTNQACACGVSSAALLYKYLFYYARSQKEAFIGMGKGGAQPNISQEIIKEHPIPLPPLTEQQRIVDRIESLFAKLDEAKEKAQAVVDGFEDRKAAILHKAFSGNLVIQHNCHSHKWEKVFLRDVVSGFKYGTSEKSDYSFTGMPVLRIPNIGENGIDFSDVKCLTTKHIDAESQIHENDILIIRSNGSRDLVGKCALVPFLDQEYAYASFLIRIKPSEKIRADYLALYLNSREARNQMSIKAKSSAGIHNINSKELGSIIVRLPSLNEQKEIVMAIQKLMQPEKQANELALEIIDQINSMKKAILARAFRGELGTNDPNDESAIELLSKILK